MEFGLSQDQLMLGDSVRKFLASEVPLDTVRQLAAGEVDDSSVWQGLSYVAWPVKFSQCQTQYDSSPQVRLMIRQFGRGWPTWGLRG